MLQADKGNQVQAQPQAFFLPLADEGDEGSSNVIDLEVTIIFSNKNYINIIFIANLIIMVTRPRQSRLLAGLA